MHSTESSQSSRAYLTAIDRSTSTATTLRSRRLFYTASLVWNSLVPAEVVSCLHSVRFYQTPDRPAFACVFARPLPASAPIALYAGVVRRENRTEYWNAADVYTWELETDSHCIINASEKGGVARFVNAEMYRIGGSGTVNCEATQALDEDLHMPTVALHTTRAVQQLTECICDYGDRYWPAMNNHLLDVWDEYINMAQWLRQAMAEYLTASGLSPDRLPVPRPAHRDESYHWHADEVQYPVWPLEAVSTNQVTVRRAKGKLRNPVKQATRP